MHNIKVSDATMGADMVTAWEFPEMLPEIIDEGMYLPKQVFNVDETRLYWKRIQDQSYISKKEKLRPGYKDTAKDSMTVLFDGNTSGERKLKPLLVYHSENPKTP